jgi:hypothetical protein
MVKILDFSLNMPFKPSAALTTWFFVNFMLFMLVILSVFIIPVIIATEFDWFIMGVSLIGILVLYVIFVFFSPVLLRVYVV